MNANNATIVLTIYLYVNISPSRAEANIRPQELLEAPLAYEADAHALPPAHHSQPTEDLLRPPLDLALGVYA